MTTRVRDDHAITTRPPGEDDQARQPRGHPSPVGGGAVSRAVSGSVARSEPTKELRAVAYRSTSPNTKQLRRKVKGAN